MPIQLQLIKKQEFEKTINELTVLIILLLDT